MRVDFLIVGQGLAGSALALALVRRGRSVLVVDRGDLDSASRVAAGLVTSLAGKGMNPAWRQGEYLPKAMGFYGKLEREHGVKLFYGMPVLRLFADEKERVKFEGKVDEVSKWVGERDADVGEFLGEHGGFEMAGGGRLDVREYLRVVRMALGDSFQMGEVLDEELVVDGGVVRWGEVEAGSVIFCRGYGDFGGRFFKDLRHRSAKGQMLTVRVDGLDEGRVVNRGGWMVPLGDGLWRCGATYEWDGLEDGVDAAGRVEVEGKIAGLTDAAFEVVEHEAGVRPIVRRSQPVVGMLKDVPEVGIFNGLGSKGVITAPSVGEHFAGYLCGEWGLDAELDLAGI